jgi:hypothetical protein
MFFRFKMVKLSDPLLKNAHMIPSQFRAEALLYPFLPALFRKAPTVQSSEKKKSSQHKKTGKQPATHGTTNAHRPIASVVDGEGSEHLSNPFPLDATASGILLTDSLASCLEVGCTQPGDAISILNACRTIHENLSIHALPSNVMMCQKESLNNIHSACTARLQAAHRINFCSVCAIN